MPAHAKAVEFLEKCEENNKKYTIAADKDEAVKAEITTVVDWKKLRTPEGRETGREMGMALHIMNETKEAFLLAVQR